MSSSSDLRHAFRTLAKARGFSFIAILTLGVGIGASTAIFSTLRALVLSPFNYPDADAIVQVWSGRGWPLSVPDTLDLKNQMTGFADFGVYSPTSVNVGREGAEAVSGVNATAEVLRVFGVAPRLGRLLEPSDAVEGAAKVIVISHALWQRRFAGDPAVIGQSLRMNGRDVTVVGVMPASFEFAGPWLRTTECDIWAPLTLDPVKNTRDSHWLCGVARLKPGVSVEQADAEIKTVGRGLTAQYPDSNTRKAFLVRSLKTEMTGETGPQVWMLFGAVALVLLVACSNVASLLLARGAGRQGEFAVRLALGAGRGRLLRLALMESAVLAVAGAVLGLLLAYGGIGLMRWLAPATEARKAAIVLDAPVLAYALAATGLTALLAGVPPALAATRTSLQTVLRADARGTTGPESRQRLMRALIIGQIALAFVLAHGAVLLGGGYQRMMAENRLFATDQVLTARIALRGDRYQEKEDRVRFWYRLEETLAGIPGVQVVGLTSKLPLEGGSNTLALVNDEVYDPTQKRIQIERSSINEAYFDAVGLTLVKGRRLAAEDRTGDIRGVVVNQAMVAKAWPDRDPLGQIIRGSNPGKPWYTVRVVGVVEDVRQWGVDEPAQPEMYLTPEDHWGSNVHVVLRSSQPAIALTSRVRGELAKLDAELALQRVRTLRDVRGESAQAPRVMAGAVIVFMLIAIGLVAVGLYGTLSYHVQRRTREIGVRLALGARPQEILGLVVRQGGTWVVMGVVLGLAGALALSSVMTSLVYGASGMSITPLVLATLAVGATGLLACWWPSRRASRADPMRALRAD